MSDEFEAAGAMATAGLVAGAIEGRGPGAAGEGACFNCDAKLEGAYCSQCGQAAHPHRSLAHVFEEFVHGLLHFDTKAWRTLPMVIFRPGTLTRNYVYGKRARYISPLATFLFTIFLMFFVFSFIEAPIGIGGTPQEQRAEAVEELAEARTALAEAERELADEAAAPAPTDGTPQGLEVGLARQAVELARAEVERREAAMAQIEAVIAAQQSEAGAEQPAPAAASGEPPSISADVEVESPPPAEAQAETPPQTTSTDDPRDISWAPGETWQDGLRRASARDNFVIVEGFPELNERIRRKFENPDLALYKVQEAAAKYSFLLVPISLPFMALLFLWKRGLTLYDHVIYTLYGLSFASILFVLVVWTPGTPLTSWLTPWLVSLGMPVHTFFHLRGAYALGWWSALWRTVFLLFFAIIALGLFLIAILVLGLTG